MDSAIAERIVREVFSQLWFAAERFASRRSLCSWLSVLAKDLARAERRGRRNISISTTEVA
jgi:DNA-directed RNA polymerase specialized sigma24 family protein